MKETAATFLFVQRSRSGEVVGTASERVHKDASRKVAERFCQYGKTTCARCISREMTNERKKGNRRTAVDNETDVDGRRASFRHIFESEFLERTSGLVFPLAQTRVEVEHTSRDFWR